MLSENHMNKFSKHFCLGFFFLALLAANARADVSLPKILGDNMVLQRDKPLPIWGRAAPGEEVTVRFAGRSDALKPMRTDAGKCCLISFRRRPRRER